MKTFGVVAVIVGVLLIILALGGFLGPANLKAGLAASVIMIVAGWILYRRNPGRP